MKNVSLICPNFWYDQESFCGHCVYVWDQHFYDLYLIRYFMNEWNKVMFLHVTEQLFNIIALSRCGRLERGRETHECYGLVVRTGEIPVVSYGKEVNPQLPKWPLVLNGHLANHGLTSLAKEATGVLFIKTLLGLYVPARGDISFILSNKMIRWTYGLNDQPYLLHLSHFSFGDWIILMLSHTCTKGGQNPIISFVHSWHHTISMV